MSNKKFVIDFDLDDKNYRQKLEKLMGEASKMGDKMSGSSGFASLGQSDNMAFQTMRMREMERQFYSQHSRAQVELSKRRVQAGPYSGLASAQDYQIVKQAQEFEKFNKVMDESQKWNKMAFFEERNRHREYRSISTRQLELDTRKLRNEAMKDDRAGKYDDADRKRKDAAAMEQIVNERKGKEADPMSRVMRQFGTHYFMNQALGSMPALLDHGGQYTASGARAGLNAYSSARMAGMGAKGAGVIGLVIAALDPIVNALGDINKNNKELMRLTSVAGQGGTEAEMQKRHLKNWDSGFGQRYKDLGMEEKDAMAGMQEYAKSGVYGGTSYKGLLKGAYEETTIERAMGISTELQQQYARTGLYGDRQDNATAFEQYSRFLESKGAGNIKVGIDKMGEIGDRNVARVPEYLKRLVELNESMIKITGEKSKEQQDSAMKFMGSIIGLGGIFKESDTASETAQGVRSAFANPKDALHQYKNVRAYRMATGNTGVVGMMEAFENMDNPKVINQMISNLAGERGIKGQIGTEAGYNEQAFIKDLQQMTGLSSQTKARKMYNQWQASGGLREEDMSKFVEGDPGERMAVAAEKLSTDLEKSGASITKFIQDFTKPLLDGITSFTNAISSFGSWVGKLIDGLGSWFSGNNNPAPSDSERKELQRKAKLSGSPQTRTGPNGSYITYKPDGSFVTGGDW